MTQKTYFVSLSLSLFVLVAFFTLIRLFAVIVSVYKVCLLFVCQINNEQKKCGFKTYVDIVCSLA